MNSCWFLHKHLILQSEMLLWCKPSAVKSANALWLDVGRFRSNSAGDPTNLQHATTSDDHHNSFEIDLQQFRVQQSLSKVSRTSSDFHQFYNNFLGEMFLDKQVFYLVPNVFSSDFVKLSQFCIIPTYAPWFTGFRTILFLLYDLSFQFWYFCSSNLSYTL